MYRSYTPAHYSTVGIQIMGQMFEQQVRMAQALGMVAFATNPLLSRAPSNAALRTGRSAAKIDASPAGHTDAAPSASPRTTECVERTHSMPV